VQGSLFEDFPPRFSFFPPMAGPHLSVYSFDFQGPAPPPVTAFPLRLTPDPNLPDEVQRSCSPLSVVANIFLLARYPPLGLGAVLVLQSRCFSDDPTCALFLHGPYTPVLASLCTFLFPHPPIIRSRHCFSPFFSPPPPLIKA